MSFRDELEKLRESGVASIRASADAASLEEARVKYFGRQGLLPEIMKKIGKQPKQRSPAPGDMVVVKPRGPGTADVQITNAALVHSIAKAFRDKLGKRDASGREIDLYAVSDIEVISGVVANVDGILARSQLHQQNEVKWRTLYVYHY